jgi:hypothetical protein
MGTTAPAMVLDPDRVEAALRARPEVERDLRRIDMGTLEDIAGAFVADAPTMARATEGIAPITDDRPRMEYTFGRPSELPKALFGAAASGARAFCPRCFDGDGASSRAPGLPARLALLDRLYATSQFRKNRLPFSLSLDANLASLYASIGREEDAVAEAKQVLELTKGAHAKASAMLCSLRRVGCPPAP